MATTPDRLPSDRFIHFLLVYALQGIYLCVFILSSYILLTIPCDNMGVKGSIPELMTKKPGFGLLHSSRGRITRALPSAICSVLAAAGHR